VKIMGWRIAVGRIWLALWTLALLAGCATGGKVVPPPQESFVESKQYVIGVGDSLQVTVWRNPELSVAVPVRPDGMISTPLVGDIMAAGKPANQLARDIRAKLEGYVRSPEVTVIVSEASSAEFLRRVRVTGAVRTPISVPYRDGMTVLDLVLLAGGTNEFASGNGAKLYRKTDGGVKVFPVYLSDILNDGKVESNYPLTPSDIVTVPERNF
jgi:polysaccharide export outer membrane protein